MTRVTLRALAGRDQSDPRGRIRTKHTRWLLAAAVVPLMALAGNVVVTPAPASADDYYLPPCAADDWIDGLAVERWGEDFKVVVSPSPDARTFGRVALNSMWHLVQACVPGLYDDLADSVYGQLACHVDLAALPDGNGGFATGPTWDLESWRPPYGEVASIAHKCSAGVLSSYGDEHPEPGEWEVYFGVDPLEKSEQEIERIRADREAAEADAADESTGFEQEVWVINTGGVGLWTRGGPGYGAPRYEVLPDGTSMTLLCQVHSQTISDWMTSDLWDRVRLGDGSQVWVSDVFVKTGSDGQVAPTC